MELSGKAGEEEKETEMTYTIKLTAKQIDAIYSAIRIYDGSYDGISQEELRDWGVAREMLSLRQIETKLDKAIGYVAEEVEA